MVEAAAQRAASARMMEEVEVVTTTRSAALTETAARPMTMTTKFNKEALDWLDNLHPRPPKATEKHQRAAFLEPNWLHHSAQARNHAQTHRTHASIGSSKF